jgi:hypothetical protein
MSVDGVGETAAAYYELGKRAIDRSANGVTTGIYREVRAGLGGEPATTGSRPASLGLLWLTLLLGRPPQNIG